MKCKLFIHATNIHQGGGYSLLSALLDACPGEQEVVALLDRRIPKPTNIPGTMFIKFVQPSIRQRFYAEWWLWQNVRSQDTVLCFGNLPPLFKLRGHVIVFVQNRYLVERVALRSFYIKARLRLGLERLWLSWRAGNVDEFVVQTPSMRTALLSSGCVVKQPVHVRPFVKVSGGYQRTMSLKHVRQDGHKRYDFFYPASGDPHKNHRRLVKAWCLLAEQGLFPSLCLTLDANVSSELCIWIDEQKLRYGLKLENVGFLPHDKALLLYVQARALIYPSLFESFGLPLIEASQSCLPVLAAELDYVRDVLDPEQTFNPESSISIVRAVKRFLGEGVGPLPLLDATQFMASVLGKVE
ncbi:glycosyltransferase [Thiovibrio frasassiensis]|uniref:Glycosyltransferase n=1 Tax=Thiovibrio frasassiensis TaxID=2984131 RepID=A0A9X4RLT7_9BACT|nr:glycosyltransferase [Thiovibrio frasassiensis]MDG4476049.1 glycosyltransferase [Thiovibrio frasassiensis]